ncbi:MAG: DUF4843 domain-containing protein [Prevotella sp.]|nr:DUF4843 domain-containing protein [Prevotella sp.]
MNRYSCYNKRWFAWMVPAWLLFLAAMTTSCEKDLPLYETDTCWLNFYYADVANTQRFDDKLRRSSYSFVYAGEGITRDTLWFEVETMGFLSDHDRAISLHQVDSTANDAVAGKHYVAFNDPSLASYYVMPAGKSRTKIPVVLLNDESLKDISVVLKFAISENENFKVGYDYFSSRVIEFTSRLSMPDNWMKGYPIPGMESYYPMYANYITYFFGNYGPVKHQFLIDQTGERWDDDYIEGLMTGDDAYLAYLQAKLMRVLAQVNADRQSRGLGALSEDDGTVVSLEGTY